jgi:hypothetical protein
MTRTIITTTAITVYNNPPRILYLLPSLRVPCYIYPKEAGAPTVVRTPASGGQTLRQTAWYRKSHPTFSDALALVRKELRAQEANRVKRRAGAQDLRPSLLGLYQISLGRYTLPLTFSEEELFFSVPLSPDSPFLVVVSAFVPPL